MDVPTRQSYVMAVVEPHERLAAAGITALVRSVGWALAPMLAGVLIEQGGLGLPLIAAGITKLSYDVLLWREFRRVKPPVLPDAPPGSDVGNGLFDSVAVPVTLPGKVYRSKAPAWGCPFQACPSGFAVPSWRDDRPEI